MAPVVGAPYTGRLTWQSRTARARRIGRNTDRLLEIFAEAEVHATFFTLGWIAQRHPALVRRIVEAGHELASHGLAHRRVDRQSPETFHRDVCDSKRVLEDAGGVAVRGYRAPTFSIGRKTPWAHAILAEAGYRYSSSVYPGRSDHGDSTPRRVFAPVPGIVEIPLSSIRLPGMELPASGGGYFRLYPLGLSRRLVAGASRANGVPGFSTCIHGRSILRSRANIGRRRFRDFATA